MMDIFYTVYGTPHIIIIMGAINAASSSSLLEFKVKI